MKASQKEAGRAGSGGNAAGTADTISRLVAEIRTHDWRTREAARWELVSDEGGGRRSLDRRPE